MKKLFLANNNNSTELSEEQNFGLLQRIICEKKYSELFTIMTAVNKYLSNIPDIPKSVNNKSYEEQKAYSIKSSKSETYQENELEVLDSTLTAHAPAVFN